MLLKVGSFTLLCRNGCNILSRHPGRCQLSPRAALMQSRSVSMTLKSRHKFVGILEQSAVLVQDGLEIQELPWVVRRLNPREFPFAVGITYTGDSHQPHQHEDDFNRRLHECSSVQQVSISLCNHLIV